MWEEKKTDLNNLENTKVKVIVSLTVLLNTKEFYGLFCLEQVVTPRGH